MTLIYLEQNDGTTFYRKSNDKKLSFWKKYGKELKYSFVYKGFTYYGGKKYQVAYFSNRLWSDEEIEKRKRNGFKGIKIYECK